MSDLTPERVQQLRTAVKEKYGNVSRDPHSHFPYPVGRESLALLGYAPEWLHDVPGEVADRFVGVGNPFHVRPVHRGERVLDVGCGCGLDTFVAASLVGPEGRAVGVDLSPEMLKRPRAALVQTTLKHVEFSEGLAEALPFPDASFDVVFSNGALNLVPDKDAAYREIARVLRPAGDFVAADLVVIQTIPEQVISSMDAWST
jgi:SAM-dependent methyltransferase